MTNDATPEMTDSTDAVQWEDLSMVTASSTGAASGEGSKAGLTGRPSTMLYLSCDPDYFTPYQVVVRKCVEFFEATEQDVATNAQGRNKAIVLGQVGIRCLHCRFVPPQNRCKGAQYYPSLLKNIYQAAQNLTNSHLLELCPMVPDSVRAELKRARDDDQKSSVGKEQWGLRAQALGVFEDVDGLRYAPSMDHFHKELLTEQQRQQSK